MSGEIAKINHSWGEQKTFTITAKANDTYGAEGPEGTFNINIPRNKVLNNFIIQILLLRFQRIIHLLQLIF